MIDKMYTFSKIDADFSKAGYSIPSSLSLSI
jgi:hypothetical protein